MDLNKLGKRSYSCALKRGKIKDGLPLGSMHAETVQGIIEEANEVCSASETELSEHIPRYTEIAEELADVILVSLTELHRRNIDIESLLHEKMKFNEQR